MIPQSTSVANLLGCIQLLFFQTHCIILIGFFIIYPYIQLMRDSKGLLALVFVWVLIERVQCWCRQDNITLSGVVKYINYAPSGDKVSFIYGEDRMLKVYAGGTFGFIDDYQCSQPPVCSRFTEDGNKLLVGLNNGALQVLDTSTSTISYINNYPLGQTSINEIDFNEANTKIMTCGSDGTFKILDATNYSVLYTSAALGAPIKTCKFTYDATHVDTVIVGVGTQTKIFQISTDPSYSATPAYSLNFNYQVFRLDVRKGSYIHLVGHDNGFGLYPSSANLRNQDQDGFCVSYSEQNDNFLGIDTDDVRIFNGTNSNNTYYQTFQYSNYDLFSCDFSPDGEFMVLGSVSGKAFVLNRSCNCVIGQYSSGASCISCDTYMSNCYNCIAALTCIQCDPSFQLSASNLCVFDCSTIANCDSCGTNQFCIDCATGFYPDPNGIGCLACSTINNCTSCQDTSVECLICQSGFYPDSASSQCLTCANLSNCLTCQPNQVQCLTCSTGFYPDPSNNDCNPCSDITNCASCDGTTVECTQCISGFYPNPTQSGCLACSTISYCFDCLTNAVQCTQCNIGFVLDNSHNCIGCSNINNCAACDAIQCVMCINGFYPDPGAGQDGCLTCGNITNCLTCEKDAVNCLTCSAGNYANPNSYDCLSCSSILNCFLCDGTDSGCIQCNTGFYPDPLTENCLACSSIGFCVDCSTTTTQCTQCSVGYFPDPTSENCLSCSALSFCVQCSQITNQCTLCQVGYVANAGLCQLEPGCAQGYFLDNSSNCIQCIVSACTECSSANICTFCADGFFLVDSSTCSSCPPQCLTCTFSNTCTSCLSGYYLNGDHCILCEQNCQTCLTNTTCLSCPSGYYLDNSQCLLCVGQITNCSSCIIDPNNDTLVCSECVMGAYFDGAVCQPCQPGCFSCHSASDCSACHLGMYFNTTDNQCQKCQPQCSTCDDLDTCRSCKDGYYLNGDDCTMCPDSNCLKYNANECRYCQLGYFLNISQKCELCSSGVANCLVCASQNTCLHCQTGFLISFDNQTCEQCSQKIPGCFYCTSVNDCHNCITGYYFDSGSCVKCPQGCRVCNITNCFTCENKYFLTAVPSCKLCNNQFPRCQTCNRNKCLTCVRGYYQSNDTCHSCGVMPGCISCLDDSHCLSCRAGFYLKSPDQKCFGCDVMEGCADCRNNQTCLICQRQYVLSNHTCIPCSQAHPNCQSCDQSGDCERCAASYFLQIDLSCQPCDLQNQGCIFCLNNITCLQCQIGYSLNVSNLCEPCSGNCEFCSEQNSTKCLKCNSQYYLDSNDQCLYCMEAMQGCRQCQKSDQCIVCSKQYYKDVNNTCQSCSIMTGCRWCSDQNTCSNCDPLFYLNSNSKCEFCKISIPGCLSCKNNSHCEICELGFYQNHHICHQCSEIQGCRFCQSSSSCSVCQLGYYLKDGLCRRCNETMVGCSSCLSGMVCMTCSYKYYLTEEEICERVPSSSSNEGGVKNVSLKTRYLDDKNLVHSFETIKFKLNKKVDLSSIKWRQEAELTLLLSNATIVNLLIKKVQWGDNDWALLFYTDNPLELTEQNFVKMPFARRNLANQIQAVTSLHFSEQLAKNLMPDYTTPAPLVVDYSLGEPQFYVSIIQMQNSSLLWIIGMIITIIVLIKYLVKALKTVPDSKNQGYIIAHIFALKGGALILYPTYHQYAEYCSGFMTADFPWLNSLFGHLFGRDADITPYPYKVFYTNLHIGSTYFLALLILTFCYLLSFGLAKISDKVAQKMPKLRQFLYSFFCFGLFFAACCSFQGAVLNPTNQLSVNGLFYILGIGVFFAFLAHAIFEIKMDFRNNFWRIRVIVKAMMISLSHWSPIPLITSAIFADLTLMFCQYCLSKYPKYFKKSWLIAHIALNICLLLIVFAPIAVVTLLFTTLLIVLALVCELYMHHHEYKNPSIAPQQNFFSENDLKQLNSEQHIKKPERIPTTSKKHHRKPKKQQQFSDFSNVNLFEQDNMNGENFQSHVKSDQ